MTYNMNYMKTVPLCNLIHLDHTVYKPSQLTICHHHISFIICCKPAHGSVCVWAWNMCFWVCVCLWERECDVFMPVQCRPWLWLHLYPCLCLFESSVCQCGSWVRSVFLFASGGLIQTEQHLSKCSMCVCAYVCLGVWCVCMCIDRCDTMFDYLHGIILLLCLCHHPSKYSICWSRSQIHVHQYSCSQLLFYASS